MFWYYVWSHVLAWLYIENVVFKNVEKGLRLNFLIITFKKCTLAPFAVFLLSSKIAINEKR